MSMEQCLWLKVSLAACHKVLYLGLCYFFYSVYINHMSAAVKCKLLLYADDSVFLASGKDIVEIEATLSSELKSVNDWLINNKLSLHLGKTQSTVFGTRKNYANVTLLILYVMELSLNQSQLSSI